MCDKCVNELMKVQFPVGLVVNVLSFYTLHLLLSHWVCFTCVHVLLPGCMSSFHPADQRKCHYGKWCQSKGLLPFPKADWPAQSCLLKEDHLYYINLADAFIQSNAFRHLLLRSAEAHCCLQLVAYLSNVFLVTVLKGGRFLMTTYIKHYANMLCAGKVQKY